MFQNLLPSSFDISPHRQQTEHRAGKVAARSDLKNDAGKSQNWETGIPAGGSDHCPGVVQTGGKVYKRAPKSSTDGH